MGSTPLKKIKKQTPAPLKFKPDVPDQILKTISKYNERIQSKQDYLYCLLAQIQWDNVKNGNNNVKNVKINKSQQKLLSVNILHLEAAFNYFSHIKFTKLRVLNLNFFPKSNFQALTWLDATDLRQLKLNKICINSLKFLSKSNFVNLYKLQLWKEDFVPSIEFKNFSRMRTSEKQFQFFAIIKQHNLEYEWISKFPSKQIIVSWQRIKVVAGTLKKDIHQVKQKFCEFLKKDPYIHKFDFNKPLMM